MQAPASWLPQVRAALLAAAAAAVWTTTVHAQGVDSIPSQSYYAGIEQLYGGELRDAQRTFNRCLTGSVKSVYQGGTIRWVDSICYHAMLGETFYHWGQPQQALDQFNLAASLYLQYPRWMLRAQFEQQPTLDNALARTAIPWGTPQRRLTPGRFPTAIPVSQGQVDNTRAVQQGGVLQTAQLWPVNVAEVVRCTALAIRRRNEILGPLGAHDSISKNLVIALARGNAPPNHWSNAWVDVMRGLAHVGVGQLEQGQEFLQRGTLAAGQFDHPLTGVALVEQGRLALNAGDTAQAGGLLAEASYAAYLYADASAIDDAFRLGELNRLAGGGGDANAALPTALAWARRERFDLLAARFTLAMADELMELGRWKEAAAALSGGASLLRDARTGVLGNAAQFLEARLQFQQGRNSAAAMLATAVTGQQKISLHNFQINLANAMFDSQALPTRNAPLVYEVLLADPKLTDVALRPLETMAVMTTSHAPAFERWLLSTLERKNVAAALEITERAKRRRLHNALPWGGRLAALRSLSAAPAASLTPPQQQLQSDLLARFPELAQSQSEATRLRSELDASWRPPLDAAAQQKTTPLWDKYAGAVAAREQLLQLAGVSRAPAELSFPPMHSAVELQQSLRAGQALLVFHDTSEGLLGLLVTSKAAAHWNCGPSARVGQLVSQLLRDLGNHDASRQMTTEDLASTDWQASSAQVFKALFAGSSLAPAAVNELIIVPDGVTWYVPFEALMVEYEGKPAPIVSFAKVRYAPTAALAFSFKGPWRRVQRTGIAAGDILPGDDPKIRAELIEPLQAAVPGPVALQSPLPSSSPAVASLLDALIVLDDVETQGEHPLAWSPLPLDRNAGQGALTEWSALAGTGPQRIMLPGMHTLAERGGRGAARRRGNVGIAPGEELFYASCTLMSAGAETMLLSRWRVGGQSTLDLMREFAQELPHTAAPDAWQRSVHIALEMPVDPLSELRVKAGKDPVELTAAHPFFWAGYLVVDSGWRPEEEPTDGAVAAAEPAVVDVPEAVPPAAVPGQPAAEQPAGVPPVPGEVAAGAPAGSPPPVPAVPPKPAKPQS